MIASCPDLVDYSHDELALKHQQVLSYEFFPYTLVRGMILRHPIIIIQPVEHLIEKYQYLNEEMGIQRDEMETVDFLAYDIDYIACRHQFLERAKVFRHPLKMKYRHKKHRTGIRKKKHRPIDRPPNPSLKRILLSDERTFVENVAGLTREEYNIFVETYNMKEKYKYASMFPKRLPVQHSWDNRYTRSPEYKR